MFASDCEGGEGKSGTGMPKRVGVAIHGKRCPDTQPAAGPALGGSKSVRPPKEVPLRTGLLDFMWDSRRAPS